MRYTLSDLLVLMLAASLYGAATALVPIWRGGLIDWACVLGIVGFLAKVVWDAWRIHRETGASLARWKTPGGHWAHAVFPVFGFVTWWIANRMLIANEPASLMIALMATVPCHVTAVGTTHNTIGEHGTQVGPAFFSHREYTLRLARKRGVLRIRRRDDASRSEPPNTGRSPSGPSHETEDYAWAEGLAVPLSTTARVPDSALDEIAAALAVLSTDREPAAP